MRSSPFRSSISPDVNPLRGAPMTRSAAPDIPVRWCQWAGSGVNSLRKPTQAQGETRCRPMLSDRIRASLACLPLASRCLPGLRRERDGWRGSSGAKYILGRHHPSNTPTHIIIYEANSLDRGIPHGGYDDYNKNTKQQIGGRQGGGRAIPYSLARPRAPLHMSVVVAEPDNHCSCALVLV